ncbi:MAG: hypothetical protein ABSD42_10015 [Candidatus Bathyarchaeia archaeon]
MTFAESGLRSEPLWWWVIFNGTQYFLKTNTVTINNISATNCSWSISTSFVLELNQGDEVPYYASPNSGTISISNPESINPFGHQSLQQITFSLTSTSPPSPSPTPIILEFPSWMMLPTLLIMMTIMTFAIRNKASLTLSDNKR